MPKNSYAAQLHKQKREELSVLYQWVSQVWADAFVIVTGDRSVMGKNTFGPERAEKILRAIEEQAQYIESGITGHDDADAVRIQTDRALAQRLGDKLIPWGERYEAWGPDEPWLKEKPKHYHPAKKGKRK